MTGLPPAEALAHAFFRLVRGFRLLERGAKCCEGVTLPQCTLLETLHRDGTQRLSSLAECLGVKISTATRLVDTLARGGLVTRKTDRADARVVRVTLTRKGTRLAEKLVTTGAASCAMILDALPPGERERIPATIARVADVVESLPSCAPCGRPDLGLNPALSRRSK
jgi:MarR family 2-MHQ and catechol resistance regulon transcriptional repressor